MNNRNISVQSYDLINAKYKLDSSEIKFIMIAIAQIKKEDEDFKEYEIKVSELEDKLQSVQKHTRLKQFAKKLMTKPLLIEHPNKDFEVYNWFSRIKYIHGEARFIVRMDNGLRPYLLELKDSFVKYNIKYILSMKSTYSIRIYQLLKQYEKIGKRKFELEELQNILEVPKSFYRYSQFKQKILTVALNELFEYSDIYFTYKEIKTGKKVTGLEFEIIKQAGEDKTEQEPDLKIYLKHKIYFNGEDKTIVQVSKTKTKGYVSVQMVSDDFTLTTNEFTLSQLDLMIQNT